MTQCRRCGADPGADDIYCANCGARLAATPAEPSRLAALKERAADGAKALELKVTRTGHANTNLHGVIRGLNLELPTGKGPTHLPAEMFCFHDAIAVRTAKVRPLSSIKTPGLHALLPHVALTHLGYKASRTLHAAASLTDDDLIDPQTEGMTSQQFAAADHAVIRLPETGITGYTITRNAVRTLRITLHIAAESVKVLKSAVPAFNTDAIAAVDELLVVTLGEDRRTPET